MRFALENVVIVSNLSSRRREGRWGSERMKGGAATAGCKARVCDNNFRLIMMRVMALRVSVAITLHEASEGQVGQLRGK